MFYTQTEYKHRKVSFFFDDQKRDGKIRKNKTLVHCKMPKIKSIQIRFLNAYSLLID